jgi:hypothetical protein
VQDGEPSEVPSRPKPPAQLTTRPAEPFRPIPATKAGITVLAVKLRRRRYTNDLGRLGNW